MLMLKRTLVALFATVLVSFVEARALRRGPPTLCFPLDIDTAVTIPLEGERSKLGGTALEEAVIAALAKQDDPIVHMETLRRAYFLGTSNEERHALGERLEDRVLDLELTPDSETSRATALAWFDLGYWRRIVSQGHERDDAKAIPCVDKAVRMQPKDGGLRLGSMYVLFDHRARRSDYYVAVAAAHAAAKDADSRLGRNLKRTLEQFSPELIADGYPAITAKAQAAATAAKR